MKFGLIVSDPPWEMRDKLKMSKVKRGAAAQYDVLNPKDIINLDVKSIAEDEAVLALWVPSAMLEDGLLAMKNWGFSYKQTWIWVKTKIYPFSSFIKAIKQGMSVDDFKEAIKGFDLNSILNFNMGSLFRQTHEVCLIGVRGRVGKFRKNKAQRSVFIGPALPKHSEKPEELQDRLDKMFPDMGNRLEMFARRERPGYVCVGYECPSTPQEDIRDSIDRLKNI